MTLSSNHVHRYRKITGQKRFPDPRREGMVITETYEECRGEGACDQKIKTSQKSSRHKHGFILLRTKEIKNNKGRIVGYDVHVRCQAEACPLPDGETVIRNDKPAIPR
jgi:hypothetical protein